MKYVRFGCGCEGLIFPDVDEKKADEFILMDYCGDDTYTFAGKRRISETILPVNVDNMVELTVDEILERLQKLSRAQMLANDFKAVLSIISYHMGRQRCEKP